MSTAHPQQRWYRGTRGEWLVVVQVLLSGLVVLGPRTLGGRRAWPFPTGNASLAAGAVLFLAGAILFVAGLLRLGRGLTVLPCPKEGAVLAQTGAYALVRHPMYSGLLAMGFAWALWVQSGCTLAVKSWLPFDTLRLVSSGSSLGPQGLLRPADRPF